MQKKKKKKKKKEEDGPNVSIYIKTIALGENVYEIFSENSSTPPKFISHSLIHSSSLWQLLAGIIHEVIDNGLVTLLTQA